MHKDSAFTALSGLVLLLFAIGVAMLGFGISEEAITAKMIGLLLAGTVVTAVSVVLAAVTFPHIPRNYDPLRSMYFCFACLPLVGGIWSAFQCVIRYLTISPVASQEALIATVIGFALAGVGFFGAFVSENKN